MAERFYDRIEHPLRERTVDYNGACDLSDITDRTKSHLDVDVNEYHN